MKPTKKSLHLQNKKPAGLPCLLFFAKKVERDKLIAVHWLLQASFVRVL